MWSVELLCLVSTAVAAVAAFEVTSQAKVWTRGGARHLCMRSIDRRDFFAAGYIAMTTAAGAATANSFGASTIKWGIIGLGDVCAVKSGPAFYKVLLSAARTVSLVHSPDILPLFFVSTHVCCVLQPLSWSSCRPLPSSCSCMTPDRHGASIPTCLRFYVARTG